MRRLTRIGHRSGGKSGSPERNRHHKPGYRAALPIAVALMMIATFGCTSLTSSDLASRTSPPRPEDPGFDIGDIGGAVEDFGSGFEDFLNDLEGSLGLDDIPGGIADALPDLGLDEVGECLESVTLYGALYLDAFSGADEAAIRSRGDDLKKHLPDDLHDDVDTVVDAVIETAEEGLLGDSGALDSPEYSRADDAISQHLDQMCSDTELN